MKHKGRKLSQGSQDFFNAIGIPATDRDRWEPVYYKLRSYARQYCDGLGLTEICKIRGLNRSFMAKVLTEKSRRPVPYWMPMLLQLMAWNHTDLLNWIEQQGDFKNEG
jgi:hypothetical protein